jgi:hypothetical protein
MKQGVVMNAVANRLRALAAWLAVVLCTALGMSALTDPWLQAQPKDRRNRLIEALETGKPALTGDTWAFVDREHPP